MNNIKSISIWLFILIFCFVLAIRLIDRPKPVELTTVQFLELAKRNAVTQVEAGGTVSNPAFATVVDRSGRIEGEVLLSAVNALDKDIAKASLDSKVPVTADTMVAFTTSYVPNQAEEILRSMRDYGVAKYSGKEPGGLRSSSC